MKTVSIARNYIKRGWNPVPISRRAKGPATDEWQLLTITAENVAQYFNGTAQNIGVQLGPKSRGLCDVDLDCVEAMRLARYLLPPTEAVFGRASAPRSHYLYVVTDPAPETAIKHHDENSEMIVELRLGAKPNKGAQTVFPGSQHKETGELIEWASEGEPLLVPYADLVRGVRGIAIGALLLRHWPKNSGGRHELARRVGGFLARAGYDEAAIGQLMEMVAREAGDEEAQDRVKAATDAAAGRSFEDPATTMALSAALHSTIRVGHVLARGYRKILAAYCRGFGDGNQPSAPERFPIRAVARVVLER